MNRVLACVFLSIGTVLVVYGLNAVDSVVQALAALARGATPDRPIWFLLAGIAAMLVGIGGLFRTPKMRRALSCPSPLLPTPRPVRRRS